MIPHYDNPARLQRLLLADPPGKTKQSAKAKPKLTSQQLADKVLPWVYALAIAVVMSTGGLARAASPDELQKAVEALRAAAPGSEEQKRAAQRVCNLAIGPLGVALWTPAGSLICRRITDVAQK